MSEPGGERVCAFITMTPPSRTKHSWAKPSLSRDFALLAGAIIALLLLLSAWVTWTTYSAHSERIKKEVEKEAVRVDSTLEREIDTAGYLLHAMGQQITYMGKQDLQGIARLLKAFDARKPMYEVWSWTNTMQQVTVSSNKGVLDEPVNVSDRTYIQKSQTFPWQAQIGDPVHGRVSNRWVIPIGMGITDSTGKYLGTLIASIDINALAEQIGYLIRREGIGFAITSRNFEPLTVMAENPEFMEEHFPSDTLHHLDVNEKPKGMISSAQLIIGGRDYSFYQISARYPYVILVGYNANYSDRQVQAQLWPRLIQILALACFLLLFLWVVRVRIIKPVVSLTESAAAMARGKPFVPPSYIGPQEVLALSEQIECIGEYLEERRRVEEELRAKIEALFKQNAGPDS